MSTDERPSESFLDIVHSTVGRGEWLPAKTVKELLNEIDALRSTVDRDARRIIDLERERDGLAVLVGELWEAAVTFDAAFALCQEAHRDFSCEPMLRDVEQSRAVMRNVAQRDDRAREIGEAAEAVRKTAFDVTGYWLTTPNAQISMKELGDRIIELIVALDHDGDVRAALAGAGGEGGEGTDASAD